MVRFTIVIIILLSSITSYGQRPPSFNDNEIIHDVPPIICPHSDEVVHHFIPPKSRKSPYKKGSAISFVPIYSAGVPVEVTEAIEQRVFPLVQEIFSSSIPVNIRFNWEQQTGGTLASASPQGFVPNPVIEARTLNVFYPMPLAEKIGRREFNTPGAPDIVVTINSGIDWCFDCDTPEMVGTRFDFVSILLHEIYHGLGFVAFANVTDAGLGIQQLQGISSIMNLHFETLVGDSVILEQEGTERLANIFQSNQLFFNLPSAGRAKIFAPNPFDPGSSISHVDEATFNNSLNALMTPTSNRGEVERDAGIANEMMYDMGWIYTHLIHEPEDITIENPTDQDFIVNLQILSDNGYDESSLMLHYSTDEFETEDIIVNFSKIDAENYQATIPASNETKIVNYYMEIVDNRGTRFSNPGVNFTGFQFANQYAFGPDMIAPELTHNPVTSIKTFDLSLPITAIAIDEFTGIDTLLIEWRLNGIDQEVVGMERDTNSVFNDDSFIGRIPITTALTESDVLEYRIIAIDASSVANTTSSPESGFHVVEITQGEGAISIYINDFNATSDDFDGNGFEITQPSGFANQAIHSEHPYIAAGDLGQLEFVYELNFPIIIEEAGKANMVFDEIVIVEPGEPNTTFGDERFWDYVIVEGKRLGESDWFPFLDGYDSSANQNWLDAYDAQRAGNITLFRERTIDLLENGNFTSGEIINIRFRLFSDPAVVGWGWAVDNLVIQDESVPVEDFILQENFSLIPNPTDQIFMLALDLETSTERLNIQIVDLSGKKIYSELILNPQQSFRKEISVSNLASGMYFVNLLFDGRETITKKLVVKR